MRDSHSRDLEENFDKSKNRADRIKVALGELMIYAVIFILCLFLVPKFICCKYTVEGKSMESNLKQGQQLLGEKISYLVTEPKRFDVAVIQPYEEQKDNYFVKRVIGLPGETIEIQGDELKIDGKVIEDAYKKEPMHENQSFGPYKLGKDEYFVLGDNRNCSIDSRQEDIGPIPKDRFIAKIFIRVWPLDHLNLIR